MYEGLHLFSGIARVVSVLHMSVFKIINFAFGIRFTKLK